MRKLSNIISNTSKGLVLLLAALCWAALSENCFAKEWSAFKIMPAELLNTQGELFEVKNLPELTPEFRIPSVARI